MAHETISTSGVHHLNSHFHAFGSWIGFIGTFFLISSQYAQDNSWISDSQSSLTNLISYVLGSQTGNNVISQLFSSTIQLTILPSSYSNNRHDLEVHQIKLYHVLDML